MDAKPCKATIDEIDTALARHYGFTEEALDGQTLAVVSLFPHQVRPVGPREIAQARAVA